MFVHLEVDLLSGALCSGALQNPDSTMPPLQMDSLFRITCDDTTQGTHSVLRLSAFGEVSLTTLHGAELHAWRTNAVPALLLELCEQGSVAHRIAKVGPLGPKAAIHIFRQVRVLDFRIWAGRMGGRSARPCDPLGGGFCGRSGVALGGMMQVCNSTDNSWYG